MKKILCFLLAVATLMPLAVSCADGGETSKTESGDAVSEVSEAEAPPAPVVNMAQNIITFDESNINAESITADGYYLYTHEFLGAVTPETTLARRDITVVEGYVAAVGDENKPTFIPGENGVTVVCVGEEAVSFSAKIQTGIPVNTDNIEFKHLSVYYAVVNGVVININLTDGIRAPEGVCAVYTPDFGKTTGTNVYGAELTVVDGKVTKVIVGQGNSEIPENGYVISIHKDHEAYRSAIRLKAGADAQLFADGPYYSVTVLPYNSVNGVRGENQVVVYKNVSSTQTNMYGYEITVDKDGFSVAESYSGNISVPAGGFAVSAHGTAVKVLESAYTRGQTVKLDTVNKQVIIISTPDLCLNLASDGLNTALESFERAKKEYLNIAYSDFSAKADTLKAGLEQAEKALLSGDIVSAREICAEVTEQAEILSYSTIESRTAQNRAMWYRAYEKSDDEVRATIEKLVSFNVNTIYLETFYDGYFIGYIDVDGVEHSASNGNYDALEGFVRIGHEYGIEVHAWCENFFTGYLNKDGSLSNKLLEKYSDKLLEDSKGNEFYYYNEKATFVFLNPNDRACRDLVLEVYRQIIEKYDIDGLHLDYIRFPELNYGQYDYGYNEDIIADFRAETGITADPRSFAKGSAEQQAWVDFRCGIITSFVGEVFDMVCATDPDIWLSCAIYPDRNYAVNTIFQDVKTWVDNGWIDEVFSMTYSGDTEFVYNNAKMYAEICRGKCFYSTGLAAFMDTSRLNFAYQLTDSAKAGADGIAVFALANISPDTYQYQITLGGFRESSTQLYLCGDTVKAQLDFIRSMLESSEILFPDLTSDSKKALLAEIEKIYSSALSPILASEKITYCRNTVGQLESLKTVVADNLSVGTDSVNEEIDTLIRWLEITAIRTEAKNK